MFHVEDPTSHLDDFVCAKTTYTSIAEIQDALTSSLLTEEQWKNNSIAYFAFALA